MPGWDGSRRQHLRDLDLTPCALPTFPPSPDGESDWPRVALALVTFFHEQASRERLITDRLLAGLQAQIDQSKREEQDGKE